MISLSDKLQTSLYNSFQFRIFLEHLWDRPIGVVQKRQQLSQLQSGLNKQDIG